MVDWYTMDVGTHYLQNVRQKLRELKLQARDAIDQVEDHKQLFWSPGEASNSIAILIKHMAGNMRSRWTDFLTMDGEKVDRNRPQEFDETWTVTREQLYQRWEHGWSVVFDTIDNLSAEQLEQQVTIRGIPHTVLEAIQRQLVHYANHVGQILFLCKMIVDTDWESLSIPKKG